MAKLTVLVNVSVVMAAVLAWARSLLMGSGSVNIMANG